MGINAVEFMIDIIKNSDKTSKELYLFIRDVLLRYINENNGEAKYHLKKYTPKIINSLDNKNISKLFIDYYNKNISSNPNKKINQNKIIKNMDLIENIKDRTPIAIIPINDNFSNSCDFF